MAVGTAVAFTTPTGSPTAGEDPVGGVCAPGLGLRVHPGVAVTTKASKASDRDPALRCCGHGAPFLSSDLGTYA